MEEAPTGGRGRLRPYFPDSCGKTEQRVIGRVRLRTSPGVQEADPQKPKRKLHTTTKLSNEDAAGIQRTQTIKAQRPKKKTIQDGPRETLLCCGAVCVAPCRVSSTLTTGKNQDTVKKKKKRANPK